ncbi:MAG: hypothetical protein AAF597_07635 [Bacteroidota bacterium]
MRFTLTLAFLICVVSAISAQATIHFDRPYHVAGEVSWFTLHPGADGPKKARVTVQDAKGKILDYFFLQADANGQMNGYYRWPFEATTGYYQITVHAFADGKANLLLATEHPVYSDQRVEADATAALPQGTLPAAGGLSVTAQDGSLTVKGLNGDAYSVAVYNADVVGDAGNILTTADQAITSNWVDTLFYEAAITLESGEPVQTNLLPVFDPATYTFGFSKTDANGTFNLQLGAFEGSKSLQVRSVEQLQLEPAIQLPRAKGTMSKPPVTEAVAAYIDLARRRRKIYQLFATVETEVDAAAKPQMRRELSPNRDFNVQDYKAFEDMFNFFKEVGGELRVRVKKDTYRAQLYNAPNQRFFENTPLYIVDGKLTRNSSYVNKMSPADVTYLAYFYDNRPLRRDFPALGNNGVVQIETVRPPADFPAADAAGIFEVKGIQPPATFQPRDAAASEVPALSPLLLWTTGGGSPSASVALPATDDFGKYRVVVIARSKDGKVRAVTTELERGVK